MLYSGARPNAQSNIITYNIYNTHVPSTPTYKRKYNSCITFAHAAHPPSMFPFNLRCPVGCLTTHPKVKHANGERILFLFLYIPLFIFTLLLVHYCTRRWKALIKIIKLIIIIYSSARIILIVFLQSLSCT